MRQNPDQLMDVAGWTTATDGALATQEADPGLPRDGDWFLLHTRTRQEKALHKSLVANGIGCFLPLMTVVRLYGKRKAKVEEPMFPGYIFLRGSRDQAFTADRTGRVAHILPVRDQEKLDWELSNLYRAITGAAPLEPFAFLTEGMRVEVRSGPFRGLQGVIEKRGQPGRLFLQIDMLGRAMSMEVDASLLDPVD